MFKKIVPVVLLCALGFVMYMWYTGPYYFFTTPPSENPTQRHTALFNEKVPLSVTVLATQESRIRGLSGTPSLEADQGVLFMFPEDGYHGIWMRDMLFPIDIIWVNAEGVVVSVRENVQPDTFPSVFEPSTPARFVFETRAYFTTSFDIKVGDRVVVPGHIPLQK